MSGSIPVAGWSSPCISHIALALLVLTGRLPEGPVFSCQLGWEIRSQAPSNILKLTATIPNPPSHPSPTDHDACHPRSTETSRWMGARGGTRSAVGVQVLTQAEMLLGETDGVGGDGQSMSRESCLELRQWYRGQTDVESKMEGQ